MLKNRILERIERHGPLSFEAYMEMCLYDPDDGYFAAGDVRPGTGADFVTSPEVSPWFGRLIGRWAEPLLTDESVLVEVGAGSGSLLVPLLDEMQAVPLVYAVERSAAARETLAEAVPTASILRDIDDLVLAPHAVVIMNEVLDNVPCRLVERLEDGSWVEQRVSERDGSLTMGPHPIGSALREWCDRYLGEGEPALLTAQTAAMSLLDRLMREYDSVSFCIADYGASTEELSTRPREDVVRTFRGQRTGFSFLEAPGTTDITVEVNTDVVLASLPDGADTRAQRDFLLGFGADEAIAGLKDLSHQMARDGDVMGQLQARSDATGLRALLDADGLGGFPVIMS